MPPPISALAPPLPCPGADSSLSPDLQRHPPVRLVRSHPSRHPLPAAEIPGQHQRPQPPQPCKRLRGQALRRAPGRGWPLGCSPFASPSAACRVAQVQVLQPGQLAQHSRHGRGVCSAHGSVQVQVKALQTPQAPQDLAAHLEAQAGRQGCGRSSRQAGRQAGRQARGIQLCSHRRPGPPGSAGRAASMPRRCCASSSPSSCTGSSLAHLGHQRVRRLVQQLQLPQPAARRHRHRGKVLARQAAARQPQHLQAPAGRTHSAAPPELISLPPCSVPQQHH
jgi:hypothetical protein